MRSWVLVVSMLMACNEAKPPAPVVAPAPVPPPVAPTPATPEPENDDRPETVASFPEPKVYDVRRDTDLLEYLVTDPEGMEHELLDLPTPDDWRIKLLAEFALFRAGKVKPSEVSAPTSGDAGLELGPAFVVRTTTLTPAAGRSAPVTLELGMPVQVTRLQGGRATVKAELATAVIFGVTGNEPERVERTAVEGTVPAGALSMTAPQVEALTHAAAAEPNDEDGHRRAVELWMAAARLERSARTREGLLRAGWKARDAAVVVRAALSREHLPGRRLTLVSACTDGAPPASVSPVPKRLTAPKTPSCVHWVSARRSCGPEQPSERERREQVQRWLAEAPLHQQGWLSFEVDGQRGGHALVVTTPLMTPNPCDDFEEIRLEALSGRLRRLELPRGTSSMQVWLKLEQTEGLEVGVASASTEARVAQALNARGRYRWTINRKLELEPSLGLGNDSFELVRDVSLETVALAPPRRCDCD